MPTLASDTRALHAPLAAMRNAMAARLRRGTRIVCPSCGHFAVLGGTVSKSWHFTPGARILACILSTKWRCWQFRSPLTVTDHSRHLDRDTSGSNTIGKHLQVFVRDNNVDQALRVLKKKMQREGVFREMKRRKAYEKPSERRNRGKAEAIRRSRKAARKQAQREGLIPSPKRREDARRPSMGQI
jgi:small subunit ribosomal protein S21